MIYIKTALRVDAEDMSQTCFHAAYAVITRS